MTSGLSSNLKTKVMKFESNQQNNASFWITYRDEQIQEEINVRFLGLETDKHMSGKTHTEFMLPTQNRACYVIGCLKRYSTMGTLKIVYHVYFHSEMMCGIIFWGNSLDTIKVFLQQKRIVRTILWISPRSTWKQHFKSLGILTKPSQYILTLTEFLVNNLAYFSRNGEIHNKFTRNMKLLHVPEVNLSAFQKGVYYMCIKVFNSLPNWTADLVQN
jgi:hypothetical protein